MTARIAALIVIVLLAGCDRNDASRAGIDAVVARDRAQAAARAAGDPARRPHADDPNPLRRKFGDLQIRELFFGTSQTQGDWRAWRPCSQQANGLSAAAADKVALGRCIALRNDLLAKAHAAGVADVNAESVMDPQLSGAARGAPP